MYLRLLIMALILAALLVTGCTAQEEEPGVVARVNGSPITLAQVENEHDLLQPEEEETFGPSLERLRQEYGDVLSGLIVQRLIEQELDERHLRISDQEVLDMENLIRSDYPEGAFEQVLIEEYISLEQWRERLEAQLALRKFIDRVLKPSVQVDYQEAEAYYLDHVSDFYLPPRYTLAVIRGESKEIVEGVRKRIPDEDALLENNATHGQVSVDVIKMREDHMPAGWQKTIKSLEPGQSSEVFQDDSEYRALFLKERHEGVFLDPSQAYPLIEEVLMEAKLQVVFREWLDRKLAGARIEVSAHLFPDVQDGRIIDQAQQEKEP